jgi:hypothetical protein
MTAPSGIAVNDVRTGGNFHNLDDMQPSQHNFPPLGATSYNREYQRQGTGKGDSRQTSKL